MTNETNNTQIITILEGVVSLLKKIPEMESHIALANSQLRAMQETNNQLADIAFDENKFTQAFLDKVEEVARETAKDEIDMDDITTYVQDNIDVSEDVRRIIDRMDLISEDKVNDMVEEYVNDNNLLNTDEVESVIDDYMQNNDYLQRDDVEDVVRDVVNEIVDERTENVARHIAQSVFKEEIVKVIHQMMHAVAGTPQLIKENSNANNTNQNGNGVQVSGVVGHSQVNGLS